MISTMELQAKEYHPIRVYDKDGNLIRRQVELPSSRISRHIKNDNWITLENGSRVLLDDDGNIKGGLWGKYDGKSLDSAFGGDKKKRRKV